VSWIGIVSALVVALVGAVGWGRSQSRKRKNAEARGRVVAVELDETKKADVKIAEATERSEATRAELDEQKEDLDRANLDDLAKMVDETW
jgi:Flp pilus assembly protein TadB